jgi:hypothetical protein
MVRLEHCLVMAIVWRQHKVFQPKDCSNTKGARVYPRSP